MLHSSPNSEDPLHPFLASIADLVRHRRSELLELCSLDIDPEFEDILSKLDGDDFYIHNEIFLARGFRKLHLEIAIMGSNLQVFHCVFFPEPTFELPIFGVDVVAGPSGISAAIMDLSPVGKDLPSNIKNMLKKVSVPSFKQVRELPAWGNIFSPFVHFIRPDGQEEEQQFLQLVDDYLTILITSSKSIKPDTPTDPSTIRRYCYQDRYCLQQKRNDKTRNVLAKAFTPQWADRYIESLLFDSPSIP